MSRRIAAAVTAVAMATLVAATVAALATPAGAAKKKPKKPTGLVATVLKDCTKSPTGLLQRRYSARVLNLAKREIKGDVAEYTACMDAIKTQLRQTKATVVGRVARTAGGSAQAGRVTLLYRGKVVDELAVKRGKSATFKVMAGRYAVRANGKRSCSATVTARAKKTVKVAVVCR